METINAHLKQPRGRAAVTATLVTSDLERMECLPRIAGMRCVLLESTIFDTLARICDSYEGGYWHFYNLSNGGFYMAPDSDAAFPLSCENYFEHTVCADTAGIIASASAYSHLSFLSNGKRFATAYHQLSEFIFQHRDAGLIRAALD
ncbi:hypothetical protein ASF61_21480 [Duganella sp. Leaf126]|uniref:antirestriction protein n=1 Tax=Duganella sp. Leaf126 TaxID=1736266 RepID=UPI0006F6655A|nr:antirestriction protein [Duganella sp. Leaf126]KQQ44703.1 hypothetical protein ASF61_21480 [Duganella sp. Leaf126]